MHDHPSPQPVAIAMAADDPLYMPLWIADYQRDTADLTIEEHGLYLRLLMAYWQRGGPLSADESRLKRSAGATSEEWARSWPAVRPYFFVRSGLLCHNRVDAELERVAEIRDRRRAAGQRGAAGRWGDGKRNAMANGKRIGKRSGKANGKPDGKPMADQDQDLSPPPPSGDPPQGGAPKGKRGTRLPDDWTLPEEWEVWARETHPEVAVSPEAEKFRDHWHSCPGQRGVKLSWSATWRNWIRRAAESSPRQRRNAGEPVWHALPDPEVLAWAERLNVSTRGKHNRVLHGELSRAWQKVYGGVP